MKKFDVVIIGAATSGSFFARKMAEQGFSVKVIEKLSQDKLGKRLDIFHVCKRDFENFGIPVVEEGNPIHAFEFENAYTKSPYDNYPKLTKDIIVGMHMPEYIALMNRWAEEKGAEFEYSAIFEDFVYEEGKVSGVKYMAGEETKTISARVVVDCSGTTSAARKKLPLDYGVETFDISDEDKFYVILRYVKLKNEEDYLKGSTGYPYYKTWIAPQMDPKGAIIGIGACHSYEYAEGIYKEFEQTIKLPEHQITHYERGTTPYTRPPYSFVGDNFIVSGDAACLTKPNNGEGVTSSMVQMMIASSVLGKALRNNDTSKQGLWDINVEYNQKQGADFASTRAILTKAVSAKKDEFEYFFKKDIIFSEKFLSSAAEGPEIKITAYESINIVFGILGGLLTGKLSFRTLKKLVEGLSLGGKLKKLYSSFPDSPSGYDTWVRKADELWKRVGKMG
jgi:flavin-dependent dehydrogenase